MAKRDIKKARSKASKARELFEVAQYTDGIAVARALEEQADAMESLENGLKAAVQGSDNLQLARTALKSGRLDEARDWLQQARSRLSVDEVAELSFKSLEALAQLDKELELAENKAGMVREGLKVRAQF